MKKEKPAISVIMPVYNGVKYIEAAVNSVLAQTFCDFELILVDDGATDGSGALCDQLSERDCRICVLHKENEGVSAARNMGIRHAKGEYIAFIDHDDCYMPDFLKKMLALARSSGVQVVKCGRWNMGIDENDNFQYSQIHCLKQTEIMNNNEFAKKYWEFRQNNDLLLTAVWNGIYLRSFITQHQILFPEELRHGFEDMNFNYQLFLAGVSIAFLPDVLYLHYIRKNQSISAGFYSDWLPSRLEVFKLEKSFICREAKEDLEILHYYEFERCMNILKRIKGTEEKEEGLRSIEVQVPLKRLPFRYLSARIGEKRMIRWLMLYLHLYKIYYRMCT